MPFNLGFVRDDPALDAFDARAQKTFGVPTDPEVTHNREVYSPVVRAQGSSNFCVDFSGCYALEFAEATQAGIRPPPFSPYFSRWNSRDEANRVRNTGTQIRLFSGASKSVGVCSEDQLPFVDPADPESLAALRVRPHEDAFIEAGNHQTLQSYRIVDGDWNGVLAALTQGFVVQIGIPVYENFYGTGDDGIVPFSSGRLTGYHAVTVWDIDIVLGMEGVWFPNSWGKTWGKKGWGFLREEHIQKAEDLWVHSQIELT